MYVYVQVNNTYYVANLQFQTPVHTDPSRRLITYYQWTPLILASQAAFFVLPFLIWSALHPRSGKSGWAHFLLSAVPYCGCGCATRCTRIRITWHTYHVTSVNRANQFMWQDQMIILLPNWNTNIDANTSIVPYSYCLKWRQWKSLSLAIKNINVIKYSVEIKM